MKKTIIGFSLTALIFSLIGFLVFIIIPSANVGVNTYDVTWVFNTIATQYFIWFHSSANSVASESRILFLIILSGLIIYSLILFVMSIVAKQVKNIVFVLFFDLIVGLMFFSTMAFVVNDCEGLPGTYTFTDFISNLQSNSQTGALAFFISLILILASVIVMALSGILDFIALCVELHNNKKRALLKKDEYVLAYENGAHAPSLSRTASEKAATDVNATDVKPEPAVACSSQEEHPISTPIGEEKNMNVQHSDDSVSPQPQPQSPVQQSQNASQIPSSPVNSAPNGVVQQTIPGIYGPLLVQYINTCAPTQPAQPIQQEQKSKTDESTIAHVESLQNVNSEDIRAILHSELLDSSFSPIEKKEEHTITTPAPTIVQVGPTLQEIRAVIREESLGNAQSSLDEEKIRNIIKDEMSKVAVSQPIEAPKPAVAAPVKAPLIVTSMPKGKEIPLTANGTPKIIRIPFYTRMLSAEKDMKQNYVDLKNEIMSYGVKSRVSNSGDTFRLHTNTYVKLTIAGKSLKLYFALNPKDYANTTLPILDAGHKGIYKEIPLVFKVKSELSLRRAKQLIADTMEKGGLEQGKIENFDWIKELKETVKELEKNNED